MILIEAVKNKKQLQAFIQLQYELYAQRKNWIAPLYQERKEILDSKKNPYFDHAEVQLFLALKDGKVVGRISAQIDFEYEKFHGERVGHFGFFESENDPEIAKALLKTAEAWVLTKGVKKILGPFSFSINEECGLLIEGFNEPQMTMIPYNWEYYPSLLESAGYTKAKDLLCWHYPVGQISEPALQIAEALEQHPGLTIRPLNYSDFAGDLEKIMEIFNEAWCKNWGFVPLTPKEIHKAAKDLKIFMDPEIAFLAELDGKSIGMCMSVPNLYELIAGLKGRLFPFGFLKLLWRIKRKKYKSGRLMLLGIKKEYRSSELGGLSVLLYVEIHKRGLKRGYEYGELSWTLEDNDKVNTGIEFMGGRVYKKLRVYEKNL